MGCILKPLYYWIHQVRLYYTYNPAPLTRIESTVYRHIMVTVCSSRKTKNGTLAVPYKNMIYEKMVYRQYHMKKCYMENDIWNNDGTRFQ